MKTVVQVLPPGRTRVASELTVGVGQPAGRPITRPAIGRLTQPHLGVKDGNEMIDLLGETPEAGRAQVLCGVAEIAGGGDKG
jgi:hypothetical protein